jgi:hypothetical protein
VPLVPAHMTTLDQLISTLPADSGQKGKAWERLCSWFLLNAPVYSSQLGRVAPLIAIPTVSPSRPIGVRTGLPLLYDPLGPDRNCSDCARWPQVQDFVESSGGPASDHHRLNGDHDGDARESLPGAP